MKNLEIHMIYFFIYILSIILFVIFWLTYIPRYSFIHYLNNLETDFVKNWSLYKISSSSKYINYFILINENLDEVILFENDKSIESMNGIFTKDSRIKTFREQEFIKDIIIKEYNQNNLNKSNELTEKKLNNIKENYKKSFYFISGYDYQLNINLDI
jgi:hypothetical protein